MKKNGRVRGQNLLDRSLKSIRARFSKGKIILPIFLDTAQERTGFTLIELIIAASLLSMIALLIYPAYRSNSRSYDLSVVESSLQQNARLGMKKMVKEFGAAMVVIPEEGNEATDEDGNNYGYDKSLPHKIAFYSWNTTPGNSDNDKIALYAALPTPDVGPIDPALTLEEEPLLYMRINRFNSSTNDWDGFDNPVPLISSDVKVTQLNFIPGGDNEDEVLITLELAREGPSKEWRTYKLVSATKLGAR
ncbi:hypothetical protein ES703_67064 [subsurface metagenome]